VDTVFWRGKSEREARFWRGVERGLQGGGFASHFFLQMEETIGAEPGRKRGQIKYGIFSVDREERRDGRDERDAHLLTEKRLL
jgi:hypothetical protein